MYDFYMYIVVEVYDWNTVAVVYDLYTVEVVYDLYTVEVVYDLYTVAVVYDLYTVCSSTTAPVYDIVVEVYELNTLGVVRYCQWTTIHSSCVLSCVLKGNIVGTWGETWAKNLVIIYYINNNMYCWDNLSQSKHSSFIFHSTVYNIHII